MKAALDQGDQCSYFGWMDLVSQWLCPGLMLLLLNLNGNFSLLQFGFNLDLVTWGFLSNWSECGDFYLSSQYYFFTVHLIQLCSSPVNYLKVCSHTWYSHALFCYKCPYLFKTHPSPVYFHRISSHTKKIHETILYLK